MMIICARIEDMALIARCVASQSLSSTHGAAETSLIQGVFLYFLHFFLIQGVFLVFLAFLPHTGSICKSWKYVRRLEEKAALIEQQEPPLPSHELSVGGRPLLHHQYHQHQYHSPHSHQYHFRLQHWLQVYLSNQG